MFISTIAYGLNERLQDSNFSNFQKVRAKRYGRTRSRTGHLFSSQTIHDDGGYAYHDGGRTELQFNIGLEEENRLRYGVAISLQPDRNLKDPVNDMSDRVMKLNKLVMERPELFDGIEMWCFGNQSRTKNRPIDRVPNEWIINGNFLFFGKLIPVNKHASDISDKKYAEIIELFERLLSVYEYVESAEVASETYRAARLVWNTNGWIRPSGKHGKVRHPKNYEYKHGFGHEEWLFDTDKLIDGWHYGFLQGFGHFYEKYQGKAFNLLFYSINNETKEKFWIGRLINIECILPMEGERVHGIYRRSGWLDEMVRDVESVGGNGRQIPQEESHGMFNCRYRSVNLEVFDEPRPEIDSEDEYLKAFYYDTLTRLPPVTYYGIEESGPRSLKHVDIPNDLSNYGAKGIEKRISKSWNHSSNGIRSDLRHKDWEKKLLERLRKIYGTNNVGIGVPCEAGYIDIVILHKKIKNLIELKTARTAKQVVREALSQVMEYGYWPGMGQGYLRFIISGVPKIDNLTKKYLEFLRGNFKIPIWYLTLDESAMELIGLDSLLNQK